MTDLTLVPTFAGIASICFIIDAFSRLIVGTAPHGVRLSQRHQRD